MTTSCGEKRYMCEEALKYKSINNYNNINNYFYNNKIVITFKHQIRCPQYI